MQIRKGSLRAYGSNNYLYGKTLQGEDMYICCMGDDELPVGPGGYDPNEDPDIAEAIGLELVEPITVYKVVTTGHMKYLSCVTDMFSVSYRVGRVSESEIGMLFCFDTLENAEKYHKHESIVTKYLRIMRCETDKVSPFSDYIPDLGIGYRETIEAWNHFQETGKFPLESIGRVAPVGTVFCKWVLPVEVL